MAYSLLFAPIADVFEDDEDGVWRFVLGLVIVLVGAAIFAFGGRSSYPQLHPMNRLDDMRVEDIVRTGGGLLRRESVALVLDTKHLPDLYGGNWLEDPGSRRAREVLSTLRPGDRVNVVYDTFTDRIWRVELREELGPTVLFTPDSVASWMPAERAAAKRTALWFVIPGALLMAWFAVDHLPRRRKDDAVVASDSAAT